MMVQVVHNSTEVIHVQVYVYGTSTCSSRVPGYSINVCMYVCTYIINTVVHMTKVQNKERESPRTHRVLHRYEQNRIIDLKNR